MVGNKTVEIGFVSDGAIKRPFTGL